MTASTLAPASPARLAQGTLAFVSASFLVQALSHWVIAADHFASVPFMRREPIVPLGLATMLVQGALLTAVFRRFARRESLARDALRFAGGMGVFLGAYIAVVEPSKYAVPSIAGWVAVEGLAAATQFLLFGAGLWLVFRREAAA